MRRAGGVLRAIVSAGRSSHGSLQNLAAAGAVGASQLRCLQSSDGPKAPPTPQVGTQNEAQACVPEFALDSELPLYCTLLHGHTQPGGHPACTVQHGWHENQHQLLPVCAVCGAHMKQSWLRQALWVTSGALFWRLIPTCSRCP